ncbi:MAG: nucleotidyl transferase AbiEii/AbiGii toxin family protein [Candidatus Omnitrophota bacterium]|nr:nucleotidyl transferase AbiEii/AbiGii toxin family protein [Candidatus Omnitrophota bacterium]
MDTLRRHEIFEIEVLEKLKNANFLKPLVFGGGTMLRLCYELNRYSTDLDLWFIKRVDQRQYFTRLKKFLSENYDLTDAQAKFNTLLLEFRSARYPQRLKIEIRREIKKCDFQERIAFSRYSTAQVILRAHTLEQAMKNKVAAALDRKDIRDFFDLEFLLRQGAATRINKEQALSLAKIITGFKENTYKVTLGSALDAETRNYYVKNKFGYLEKKLKEGRDA